MPNRILKESICTSENIDQLEPMAECFFYRLMVQCDDFGCMDARANVLKAKCFGIKVKVTVKNVEKYLQALIDKNLIIYYTVDNKPYLQMTTWSKHQQIRAKHRKYPRFEDGVILHEIICNQLQSNVTVIQSNRIRNRNPIEEEEGQKSTVKCYEYYQQNIGLLGGVILQEINCFLDDGITDELICFAVDLAVKANARSWNYISKVLRDCVQGGVKTVEQFKLKQATHTERKGQTQSKPPNMEKYKAPKFERGDKA